MVERLVEADDYLIIIIHTNFYCFDIYIFLVEGVFRLLIFCVHRLLNQYAPSSSNNLSIDS